MKRETAKDIIIESLDLFESSKGSLLNAVQKLRRAASIIKSKSIVAWCDLHLADPIHVNAAKAFINCHVEYNNEGNKNKAKKIKERLVDLQDAFFKLGHSKSYVEEFNAEINAKVNESYGGWNSVGFIEEKYNDLVKLKSYNDGTYYKTSLNRHLTLIREHGHKKASIIFEQLSFQGLPESTFDILKSKVDDKLLDLYPELAEQLMIAFKSVASNDEENWSQALTTGRRLIEKLADLIFSPSKQLHKGRKVDKPQYLNRIWAFLDQTIESETNKELAKNHVDLLGKYIESTYRLTNKGVHSTVSQEESIKGLFHIYLLLAELLKFVENGNFSKSQGRLSINTASLDELEAIGGLSRNIAKEVIKLRVQNGSLTKKTVKLIKGIGPKTFIQLKSNFDFK